MILETALVALVTKTETWSTSHRRDGQCQTLPFFLPNRYLDITRPSTVETVPLFMARRHYGIEQHCDVRTGEKKKTTITTATIPPTVSSRVPTRIQSRSHVLVHTLHSERTVQNRKRTYLVSF